MLSHQIHDLLITSDVWLESWKVEAHANSGFFSFFVSHTKNQVVVWKLRKETKRRRWGFPCVAHQRKVWHTGKVSLWQLVTQFIRYSYTTERTNPPFAWPRHLEYERLTADATDPIKAYLRGTRSSFVETRQNTSVPSNFPPNNCPSSPPSIIHHISPLQRPAVANLVNHKSSLCDV